MLERWTLGGCPGQISEPHDVVALGVLEVGKGGGNAVRAKSESQTPVVRLCECREPVREKICPAAAKKRGQKACRLVPWLLVALRRFPPINREEWKASKVSMWERLPCTE